MTRRRTPSQTTHWLLATTLALLLTVPSALAGAYRPDPEQAQRALKTLRHYLAQLQQQDYESAYDTLDELVKSRVSRERWAAGERKFRQRAGSPALYDEPQVRWHLDPPNAAKPGFYVEAVYGCQYPQLDPCRETVMLYSALGERFSVIRHSRSYVNTETGKRTGIYLHLPGQHSQIQ